MSFQRATKQSAKLRCALFGPSGSGKTKSALRIASGLGSKIAFIDTERGSASKYANEFEFDVCELTDRSIQGYQKAIGEAGDYDVLIIDSLTHAWQELLTEVEKLAKAKYQGNTWGAWSEGTPKQRGLVDSLLTFPGHIIATMRAKTEWIVEKDDRTQKSKPRRVGTAPEQGKGIEYEFDLLIELSAEHIGTVLKDRTGKFQDQTIELPDEAFGRNLLAWLSDGEAPKPRVLTKQERETLVAKVATKNMPSIAASELLEKLGFKKSTDVTIDKLPAVEAAIAAWQPAKKAEQKTEPANNGNPLDLPEVLAPADPREEILDLIRSLELEGMTTNEAYDVVERKSGVRDVKYIMVGEEHLVIDALNAELKRVKKAATA